VRRHGHTTFDGLDKNIQVLGLGPQAFQFQIVSRGVV
jgi:hypothetical protein